MIGNRFQLPGKLQIGHFQINMLTTEVNLTRNEEQKAQLLFSELNDGLHGQLTFFVVVNSFLSVTAFLGNALILIALHKECSLHPPSKLFLRSLATTDLCVGLIAEPLRVAFSMSVINQGGGPTSLDQ